MARPVSNSGQVFSPTSERLSRLPNAPSTSAANASTGLCPDAAMIPALTTSAPHSASSDGNSRPSRSMLATDALTTPTLPPPP